MFSRFPFLTFPLHSFTEVLAKLPPESGTRLRQHLKNATYSIRLVRYWWAGQALAKESRRLGRPLTVVDVGCERGWLKHFTPEGVVDRWIGLDWNPRQELIALAMYDEVHHANFDMPLPLPSAVADAVVCLHVFEHLPRPGATIVEISRLLGPGGIFLGGSPTMPGWLAGLREKYFRNRLSRGLVAFGGHITVLSPQRWKNLASDAGLTPEFITGSHLVRYTGSKLENYRWWLRLNQIWGALLPSLGSEVYIQARRTPAWASQTDRLSSQDPHWRGLWVGLGLASVAAIAAIFMFLSGHRGDDSHIQSLTAWLDAHQKGTDIFVIGDSVIHQRLADRQDTLQASNQKELVDFMHKHPGAHLLLSMQSALELIQSDEPALWKVDSHLDLDHHDYLLLRFNDSGTALPEYLLGHQ
ncbi:Ubiquinone/menaquinone biosynthesis C-methylase UbiE [Prosthecobacter debontii]|uniref:Ubiquinone/menaquinone biosynthesis C-methylase UbiE n=1 Tax=Prosthecobacter debontii TaxID=48467 RepID=A0A1T4YJ49_9BACT|nr:class I SAM-dependent methyltransferase [Prosthecobacter debontii]SKB01802.1 Ubiquinone/menaquinone biosynthesis C-methylase UbiE [Prosthecobacter debontii]